MDQEKSEAGTSFNSRYTLRAQSRPRAWKTAAGLSALCAVFLRHIFAVAVIAPQFLYRNRKNVSYLETLSEMAIYKKILIFYNFMTWQKENKQIL